MKLFFILTCVVTSAGIANAQQCTPPGEESDTQCSSGEICSNSGNCVPLAQEIGGQCNLDERQCKDVTQSTCQDHTGPTDKKCKCPTTAPIGDDGDTQCLAKVPEIGLACVDDRQCADMGATCQDDTGPTDKKCKCPTTAPIGDDGDTQCLAKVPEIGLACVDDRQCADMGATCQDHTGPTDKKCLCTEGFLGEIGGVECLKVAELIGDSCKILEQCSQKLGDLSECQDEFCSCKRGTISVPEKTACVNGLRIGEACGSDWQCVQVSVCSRSNRCTCPSNEASKYVPSEDLLECLVIKNELGEPCSESQQCKLGIPGEFSDCLPGKVEKVCNCTSDGVTDGNDHKCLKKAGFVGDPCSSHNQCIPLGESRCFSDVCRCIDSYIPSGDAKRCLMKKKLGEDCEDTAQCSDIGNAECAINSSTAKTCKCLNSHIEVDGACLKLATQIGETCSVHAQCSVLPESTCEEGFCSCIPETHLPSVNNTACLRKLNTLYEPCIENIQCQVKNSECRSRMDEPNIRKCQCPVAGFHEHQGRCFEIQDKLNGPCEITVQCTVGIGENAECLNDVCKCKNSSQPFEDKCYVRKGLRQQCSGDIECTVGVNEFATCNKTESPPICKCLTETLEAEDSCWRRTFVGDNCKDTKECTVSIIGPSMCNTETKKCECEATYYPSNAGFFCARTGSGVVIVPQKLLLISTSLLFIFDILFNKLCSNL